MTLSLAIAGGKGGVTKSTIARAVAVAYAGAEWDVLVADLELGQATVRKWNQKRIEAGITPAISVQSFGSVSQVAAEIKRGERDLIVVDCPAFASKATIDIAEAVDLIVLPTSYTDDDLDSTAETANSLVLAGIAPEKIAIVFSGVAEARATHERENDRVEAGDYWSELPYHVVPGYIPHQKALATAQNVGRAITECHYPGPRRKADKVIQALITRFEQITEDKQ